MVWFVINKGHSTLKIAVVIITHCKGSLALLRSETLLASKLQKQTVKPMIYDEQ